MRARSSAEGLITIAHLELMNKIILATGMIVGYAYGDGVLHRVVQRQPLRAFAFINRAFGPYGGPTGSMISLQRDLRRSSSGSSASAPRSR
jgi:hypothetical protein